jgi:RHS repeat-associated protein
MQDVLGSVVYTSGKHHGDAYSYDAFGMLYAGNLEKAHEIGYNGKRMDPATKFYDYGFRDYSPQLKRFTTIDPIKDGLNWYVYVNNDPINYIDLFGLDDLIVGNGLVLSDDTGQYYSTIGMNIKKITKVVVTRNSNDDYFSDKLEIKVGDLILLDINVQSTATWDDPDDDNDGTLDTGNYKLTLLPKSQSPSYANGMSISGNGVDINSGYMMHPDEITNLESLAYGTVYDPPISSGCIVTDGTDDFNDARNELERIGYKDWESADMKIKNK